MSAQTIVTQEIALSIKRENTLNTLYQNIEDYKRHVDSIIINFDSIVSCLSDFFHERSSYFKPYLLLND